MSASAQAAIDEIPQRAVDDGDVPRDADVDGAIYANCLPFLAPDLPETYLALERMLYASL